MILMTARYFIKDGHRDQVLADLSEMAEEIRKFEPGCVSYEVWGSNEHPNQFLLCEVYIDEPAADGHRRTAHFERIIAGRIVPKLERREREFFSKLIG
ncbi:putative quinol monooxygenase [Pelagibacterium luteolum]|uniref:Quinol monooxygenase YgiN n=1 Tax=Pelagibacterium luteolum TaxID=440168 RepID=A0A1G7UZV8_9HYPH|nr:putative quinol monooxygenase [Pelagibacterium luteolum]SDG53073.1 Quinol monooxygenase YgiN [Pelagibacterium luteolum]